MPFASGDSEPDDSPRPEPGSIESPAKITDPRALRALAHPARIAILHHLALDGPATATDCAQVAGLSPSACSYHLRALARYGFVEEDAAEALDGRHRPWRTRVVAMSIGGDPDLPEAARVAGRLAVESIEARVEEIRAEYRDHEAEYPGEWQRAAGLGQDVLHLTAAELTEVKDKFNEILATYRRLAPHERPEGARRVLTIMDFTPWFSPDGEA